MPEQVGIQSPTERVVGIIPARLASTRLPNKPLVDIAGKTMIERVWERACRAQSLHEVVIATPDMAVMDVATQFGAQVVMTSALHRSGTDRLAEAAVNLGLGPDDIIVNIQGDEPMLDPEAIDMVTGLLRSDPSLPMASLMCPCPAHERGNPACVKVVCSAAGDALYFSRSHIPFPRTGAGAAAMQHVGLYAYRGWLLSWFAATPASSLELAESLEQLRVLEHGHRIAMARVEVAPVGVDTHDDLERVRAVFSAL